MSVRARELVPPPDVGVAEQDNVDPVAEKTTRYDAPACTGMFVVPSTVSVLDDRRWMTSAPERTPQP